MADNKKTILNNKKRKRGPYLSYLVNSGPLLNDVPKSTLKSWSQTEVYTSENSQEVQKLKMGCNESLMCTLDDGMEEAIVQTDSCDTSFDEIDTVNQPNVDTFLDANYNSVYGISLPDEIPEPMADLELQESEGL